VCADLRQTQALPRGAFDLAVANPPYFSVEAGAVSPDSARGAARSEITCTLADVCAAAGRALRCGGRFSLVFRPERMAELFQLLRQCRLEPKRLRFVQYTAASAPSLLLLECRKGGRPGLAAEPPLLLKEPDGRDTAEADQVYFRNR
jgi:tRNA1(Val) A37 N6-methylase TrmN6